MASSSTKKPSAAKTPAKAKTSAKTAPKVAPKAATIEAATLTAPDLPVENGVEAEASKPAKAPKAAPPLFKKKDLVARVVEAMDGKKKGGVKEIVEATLAALGEALQKGEALNLRPFGKARVAKSKGEGADSMITLRLRGAGEKIAPKGPKEALAEVGEDD